MKLIYGISDRPSVGKTLLFAFQQMIAIMAATLLVPMMVSTVDMVLDPAAALFGAAPGQSFTSSVQKQRALYFWEARLHLWGQ